jgi:RES domain-containing protein
MIYTASSRALAMAEVLVHFALQDLPDDFFMLVIYIPDSILQYHITEDQLPPGWKLFPYGQGSQRIGEAILQTRNYGVIKAPSAVVKGDYNYLVDPAYQDFDQIKIVDEEKFPFDKRLVYM